MSTTPPSSSALISDFGWGDGDSRPGWGREASVMLVVITVLCVACQWLASGFPPLMNMSPLRTTARDDQLQEDQP